MRTVINAQFTVNILHMFLIGANGDDRPVPDAELLTFCDWMICHGGQNTVASGFAHSAGRRRQSVIERWPDTGSHPEIVVKNKR